MGWVAESFRESTNLEHHESMRILLFILKSVSAIAYVYVLGYLAAGGTVDTMVWLILLIGAIFDLVPEALTLHNLNTLPDYAQRAELTQLGLASFAYVLLVATLFGGTSLPVFPGYIAFSVVWIISFLVQESVFFLLGEAGNI